MRRTHQRRCGAAVLACALWLSAFPGWSAEQAEPPPELKHLFSKTAPVEPGDRCVVCNTRLSEEDKVYLVEGQRVGIMESMEPELFSEPWAYIGRLKPRGGLFGGEMAPAEGAGYGWLFLGAYALLGVVFSGLCAHRALNAGAPPIRWFLAGFFFNAAAYVWLVCRGPKPQAGGPYSGCRKIHSTAEPQECPDCGKLNHPSARECLGCGKALEPQSLSEASRLSAPAN